MSTTRLRLVVASRMADGNPVSSCEAPFSSRTWGTSRFPAPLHAHGATKVAL